MKPFLQSIIKFATNWRLILVLSIFVFSLTLTFKASYVKDAYAQCVQLTRGGYSTGGGGGCRTTNPLTGGCSCPAGSSAIRMFTTQCSVDEWAPRNDTCSGGGSANSRFYFCS